MSTACPYCQTQPDTQEHSFQCESITGSLNIEGKYQDIFLADVPVEISETVTKITQFRNEIL